MRSPDGVTNPADGVVFANDVAVPVVALDRSDRIARANPAFCSEAGLEMSDLIGMSLAEVGVLDSETFRFSNGEGRGRAYATRSRLPRDGTGVVLTLVPLDEDRPRVPQTLEADRRLIAYLQRTPTAAIEWNTDRTVRTWNPAAEQIFGYTEREAVGRDVFPAIIPPEILRSIEDVWAALCENRGGSRSTNENMTKSGRRIVCDWYNTPLFDDQGKITGVLTLAQDISARRAAEDALRESERRFREILEQVELFAIILDRDLRVIFCNDYLLDMTGYSRDTLAAKPWAEVGIPPDQRDAFRERAGEVFRDEGFEPRRESQIITASGELRTIAWTRTALRDLSGNVVAITALGADITDRLLAETQLAEHREHLEHLVEKRTAELERSHRQLANAERLASLGELAAGIGHDLSNILLPMRCRLDALRARPMPDASVDDIDAMQQCFEFLDQLSKGLRTLTRDPRAHEQHVPALDLAAWWRGMQPVLARRVPADVDFNVTIDSELPSVRIASHRIGQAVLNLLVNGIDAIEDAGRVHGQLGLTMRATEDRAGVRVSVSDNGAGIGADAKDRIFEPFFTTKKRALSTGLGLAMVDAVVRSAGGETIVESEPDQGTTISLILPAVTARTPNEPKADPAAADSGSTLLPGCVVVCTDARLAAYYQQTAESSGFLTSLGATPPTRGPASLLFARVSDITREFVREFLAQGADTRVLLVGELPDDLALSGVIAVPETAGHETLQSMLDRIAGFARKEPT